MPGVYLDCVLQPFLEEAKSGLQDCNNAKTVAHAEIKVVPTAALKSPSSIVLSLQRRALLSFSTSDSNVLFWNNITYLYRKCRPHAESWQIPGPVVFPTVIVLSV